MLVTIAIHGRIHTDLSVLFIFFFTSSVLLASPDVSPSALLLPSSAVSKVDTSSQPCVSYTSPLRASRYHSELGSRAKSDLSSGSQVVLSVQGVTFFFLGEIGTETNWRCEFTKTSCDRREVSPKRRISSFTPVLRRRLDDMEGPKKDRALDFKRFLRRQFSGTQSSAFPVLQVISYIVNSK